MKSVKFTGRITGGHLPKELRESIARVIRSLEGKVISVEIKVKRKPTSLKQHAFYRDAVLPLVTAFMNEEGNNMSEEETHEYLKRDVGKLVKRVKSPLTGEWVYITRSMAEVSSSETEAFIEQIRATFAPFSLHVPRPNEHMEVINY